MAQPVNLLSWRETKRRECLRFWAVLFVGSGLVALTLALSARSGEGHSEVWRELRQQNDRTLQQALIQHEKRLHETQRKKNVALGHEKQRDATRRWRSVLTNLAENMPEQAWLTALHWQGEALRFSLLANRFPALSQMEKVVRQWPDFRHVTPGPVSRDKQGRWQFSYQLSREASDAVSH